MKKQLVNIGFGCPIFPLHDCSSYPPLHVRLESLGFVHRSGDVFYRPVPNLSVTIRNFVLAWWVPKPKQSPMMGRPL